MEHLCGIKAHTLRIWESRYEIIKPNRTKNNIRYYEDADLKLVLNIALLNKNGYKISKIAQMSRSEIAKRVAEISDVRIEDESHVDALTLSMIEMNEYNFDRIFNTNIEQIGFERTILEIVYPFLDKISLLWLTGSIQQVQENFITCMIRQKIIGAIDNLPINKNTEEKAILSFLPKGESQELSLLLFKYLAKKRGFPIIYLGTDIDIIDVKDACKISAPHYIFTIISETHIKTPVQDYIDTISQTFPEQQILLSGYQMEIQDTQPPSNVTILKSTKEIIGLLDDLGMDLKML